MTVMFKVVIKHIDYLPKKKTIRSNCWYPTKEAALKAIFCMKQLIRLSNDNNYIIVPNVNDKKKTTSFYQNATISGPFEEEYKK